MTQLKTAPHTVCLKTGLLPDVGENLRALLADVLQVPEPAELPIIRAASLLGDPALAEVKRSFEAPEGSYAVQESQNFLGVGDLFLAAGTEVRLVCNKDCRAARYVFEMPNSGATMDTRVRFLKPADIRSMTAPKLSSRTVSDDASTYVSKRLTASVIARYVALAQDPNPLHTDKETAQSAGFVDVIAPGMLLCGLAETAFRHRYGDATIKDLRARFLSPASIDTSVQVVVSQASDVKTRVFLVGSTQDIHAIVDVFV